MALAVWVWSFSSCVTLQRILDVMPRKKSSLSLILSLFAGQLSLGVQFMTTQWSRFLIVVTIKDTAYNNSINWQAHDTTALQSNIFGTEINRLKGKVHPRSGHESPEVKYRYRTTLSLTSALDGVGGQRHAPAVLPLVMIVYPLYRRLGGP